MKTITTVGFCMALAACAATELPPEFVTHDQFRAAQEHAARLGGFELPARRPYVTILHAPIEDMCEMNDGRCPHAALHQRTMHGSTLHFRDDRPWQSDRGHHFGIVVHEAAHTLQPTDMTKCEMELQAHTIQAAWLDEQGDAEMAANVRQDAGKACS